MMSYSFCRSLRDKFGVIVSLLLARPLLAGPPLARPLLAGPLLARPLLAGPFLAGPFLAGPFLAGPFLGGPFLGGPFLGGPYFSYIQDHFCCSLRDKFGVIFSLLPFFLIYKTKWLRNGVFPLLQEEYSTDEFSKHILFCLFIHETDSYICKSCQVFFFMI